MGSLWKVVPHEDNSALKQHTKNPQLNCQPRVTKLRFVAKYMPKVEGLVGV
jgi:hypothetical protein